MVEREAAAQSCRPPGGVEKKMACYYTAHLTYVHPRAGFSSRNVLERAPGLPMEELTRKPRRWSPGRSPAGSEPFMAYAGRDG